MKSCFLFVIALAATATSIGTTEAAAPRPNVVFLLADDLGWADVSYHSGEVRTPCIDRLAAAGTRLEQFYVQPVCSPTRAALMTGRYPMRVGIQDALYPWSEYGLPLEERTLPQALREAGYVTAICGKWHLGHYDRAYLPLARGFDHQYGLYLGSLDYFTHLREGGLDWHRDDRACFDEGYTTHLLATEAVRVINEHDAQRPLFLYVPFNAVHGPHQVPESYTEPYRNLPEKRRVYAGMVAAMDEAIGQITAAVEKRGWGRNTLIFFTSDNGGPNPGVVTDNGPLRAGKATPYEGGTRVPAVVVWEGRVAKKHIVEEPLHMVDWYPTLLNLAGASLEQKLPIDGHDAWPTIVDGKPSPHDAILVNQSPEGGAVRVGDWKLVVTMQQPEGATPRTGKPGKKKKNKDAASADSVSVPEVELFNLAIDPNERTNVAAEHPDRVRELRDRYDAFAAQSLAPKSHQPTASYKPLKVWGEPE